MSFLYASLLLIAPLYIWRFSIGGLPTNFLMLATGLVIVLGLIEAWRNGSWLDFKSFAVGLGKPLLIGVVIVLAASVLSLVSFGMTSEKLAQWMVLYIQPIILFFLLGYYAQRKPEVRSYFITAAYVILFAAGAWALVQFETLYTLPPAWWGNSNEPKRAIGLFAHPNAYALFATPLLAWLIPNVVSKLQEIWQKFSWLNLMYVAMWLVGAMGLFLSLSRGAWIGLIAAAGVYVLLSANKKMLISFIAAMVILAGIVLAVPNLRYRAILPFYGEKSAVARLSLWQTGTSMIKDNPVLGKGINGFNYFWDEYNTDFNLDHYNFPHNIFLNFWVDLGLLGLLGMILVMANYVWQGIIKRRNDLALGALLFIVAIVMHGLIDIPYLKNDLALVFWLVLSISFVKLKPS